MSIHLTTGQGTTDHVTSADAGSLYAGIVGTGRYVLDRGNKFAYEIVSNNLIKIKDGDLLNQGRHINIAVNDYEECVIENGLQSVKRNDLIVIRYTRNTETEIEQAAVVVIKGTSGDRPADPSYISGNILNGDAEDDFPLYRVRMNGLNIEGVDQLFVVSSNMNELQNSVEKLHPIQSFDVLDSNADSGKIVDSLLLKEHMGNLYKKIGKNCLTHNLSSWTSAGTGVSGNVNIDNSIVLNGVSKNSSELTFGNNTYKKGTYRFSGCPTGGSSSTYYLAIQVISTGATYYDYGNGIMITFSEDTYTATKLYYSVGQVFSNTVFYPMMRYEDVLNSEYEPYTPGNLELYSKLKGLFHTEMVQYTANSISAGSYVIATFTVPTVAGYTPFIAIMANNSNVTVPVDVSRVLSGASTFSLVAFNPTSNVMTNAIIRANVVYLRSI